MRKIKIGLLALYLQLYDDTCTYMRPRVEAFYQSIANELGKKGLDVATSKICRTHDEFADTIAEFEIEQVSAVVTLHLSYSPSLECINALTATHLPLIVLNTTETFEFNSETNPDEIMFNHGIHGVQDMCNLLLRRGKDFEIFSGHYLQSDVLDRICRAARAATVAKALLHARVGLVGQPFDGMGDFRVPFDELRQIGISVANYDMTKGAEYLSEVTPRQIEDTYQQDSAALDVDPQLKRDVYDRTARTALAIRRWVQEEQLTAFSINFLATTDSPDGLPVMPFTECSRAMSMGIGYAGEGDVLTAALVGALLTIFPDTSFSEMFCPDWKGNSVFLSHMGEINYLACSRKPYLTEKDFPFTNAENPTVAYGTFKKGKACFVNLAPLENGKFRFIIARGQMLDIPSDNALSKSINGWFKPESDLTKFLSEYSRTGGTHHGAIVYSDEIELLHQIARFMSFDSIII